MEQLIFFHDHSLLILIQITVLVFYLMFILLYNKFSNRFLLSGHNMEIIWTIIPAVVLMVIALPSLHILYLLDEIRSPSLTLKSIGHQWYWRYEYPDFFSLDFDSYIVPSLDLSEKIFRLLEVDNRVVLPLNLKIRLLVTSSDVIHSWAIPSLGVKVDANPGRLNQTRFIINRSGLFFGQCSEICGVNHRFIPILLEAVNLNIFINWVSSFK